MGKLSSARTIEYEAGGIYHKCLCASPEIESIIKTQSDEHEPINGQIFPYISHYLLTGDLIYPAHEGDTHISLMLNEMGRLGIIQKLIFAQNHHKTRTELALKKNTSSGKSETLRIKTKNSSWSCKSFFRLPWRPRPLHCQRSSPVYRPPLRHNKGSTLVIVKSSLQGNAYLKVHGHSSSLCQLLPTNVTIVTIPTHHHLNSYGIVTNVTAIKFIEKMEEFGYIVSVWSSRVENKTGTLITQWLMYRRYRKDKSFSSSIASSKKTSVKNTFKNNCKPKISSCRNNFGKCSIRNIFGSLKSVNVENKCDSNSSFKRLSLNSISRNQSKHSVSNLQLGSLNDKRLEYPSMLSTTTLSAPSTREELGKNLKNTENLSSLFQVKYKNNTIDYKINDDLKYITSDRKHINDNFIKSSELNSATSYESQKSKNENAAKIHNNISPLFQRSLSTTLINYKERPNLQKSSSLWSICSRASVKKAFSLFL